MLSWLRSPFSTAPPARKLLQALGGYLFTLWLASILIFLILEILPGDPSQIILGVGAREDTIAALRSQMGLDKPLWWRYAHWISDLAQGELGQSHIYHIPVAKLIQERLPVSLPLLLMAMSLIICLSLGLALIQAYHHKKWADRSLGLLSQLFLAMPNFWLGIGLIVVFALRLHWFPAGGFVAWSSDGIRAFASLCLPALALALPQTAVLARVTRAALLQNWQEDYVKTLLANGYKGWYVLWRYVLLDSYLGIVTIIGLQISFLITGSVFVEQVFALPGLGRLLLQAILSRDLPLVKALGLMMVVAVLVINAIADSLAKYLDPRLRH